MDCPLFVVLLDVYVKLINTSVTRPRTLLFAEHFAYMYM